MATITIESRSIGAGAPVYVIAEIGVNHNGDPERALALVDIAADAGADAVKLQTFDPPQLVAAGTPQAGYQRERAPATDQLEMLRGLVLERSALQRLVDHAHRRGVHFLSTPFDHGSVAVLRELGVPAWKVGSGDLTNHPLLRVVAQDGRPVILSTGMADLDEIHAAVAVLREGTQAIALLHCVSSYPTPPDEANLRAMDTLAAAVPDAVIGYSDHCLGPLATLAAVARGAAVIERHITLDRTLPGPDHAISLEPGELHELVTQIRSVEAMLGGGDKRPSPAERDVMAVARRSVVAERDLPAGTTLAGADLGIRRPGTGLAPSRLAELIGRRLARAVAAGAPLHEDDLER